jgi:hypothetical protein
VPPRPDRSHGVQQGDQVVPSATAWAASRRGQQLPDPRLDRVHHRPVGLRSNLGGASRATPPAQSWVTAALARKSPPITVSRYSDSFSASTTGGS